MRRPDVIATLVRIPDSRTGTTRRLAAGLGLLILVGGPAWAFPTTAFLTRYWHRPLPLGGPHRPTAPFSEPALSARACGQCHIAQYRAWRQSRHAQAMGPGVVAQLAAAGARRWAFVRGCLSCHAPGARQWRAVRAFVAHDAPLGLAAQGVTCADCHVRHYRRFGPPLRRYLAAGTLVHRGFVPESAFLRSRFCISCHQFHKTGARLDGVLLENTYNEWRASPYARRGITCQSCHMPDGSHRFKGIHNPRFVRRALTIHFHVGANTAGGPLRARLTVTNTGVGHDFPTYTTPLVILTVRQQCGIRRCPGRTAYNLIGRRISLDLRHQYFDTRLPPGATHVMTYKQPPAAGVTDLDARIVVEPDAAYVRFFRAYLATYGATLKAYERALINRALHRDEHSAYVLWHRTVPIAGP